MVLFKQARKAFSRNVPTKREVPRSPCGTRGLDGFDSRTGRHGLTLLLGRETRHLQGFMQRALTICRHIGYEKK